MKSAVTLLFSLMCVFVSTAQEHPWQHLKYTNNINPDNYQNPTNYVEVGPNNTIFLLQSEEVFESFGGEWDLMLKYYDGTTWVQKGQVLRRNVANNEAHLDFLITSNGSIFLGMRDSIYQFDEQNNQWNAFFVPEYVGGLTANDENEVFFIHRTQGATGIVNSDLHIAKFDNGSVTLETPVAIDFLILPRVVNASNKIIFKGDEVYVSLVQQSSNQLYFFKGTLDGSFIKLEADAVNGSTIFAGLGLSSMAVTSDDQLVVALRPSVGNPIQMLRYNDVDDNWQPFDTTGINSNSTSHVQLRLDNEGVLHLIYQGGNSTGFLFKRVNDSWEHIGPTSFWSQVTINQTLKPWLAFDAQNNPVFVCGHGSSSFPLHVFRYNEGLGLFDEDLDLQITIYPNPTKSSFSIEGLPMNATVHIFNAQGQKMKSLSHAEIETNFGQIQLSSGLYFLKIELDGETVATGKVQVID
jgi:hypothetical protein